MAQCHIQWLYLAVHGCKTYLNLNLNCVVQLIIIIIIMPQIGGIAVGITCITQTTIRWH
jgi:hypothetical protein